MQRLARGVERLLLRAGVDLIDLVGDDLIDDGAARLLLGGSEPEDIAELLGSERLRIRPLLVILSARAAGAARIEPELQHTAELLHLALSLHDIALGQPGGRRRRVARRVLKRVGRSHVTVRALELSRHAGPPEALSEVIDTLRAYADGEQLARSLRNARAVPRVRDVQDHADVHHGALLSFCCRSGALAGRADVPLVASFGRYGRHIGRVWTHAEDLVALGGPEGPGLLVERAESGRPVFAVAAAAGAEPEIGRAWQQLMHRPELSAARLLNDRVASAGGLAATREAIARSSWSARQALRGVPASPYRDALDALAAGLAWSGA